jgi:hypothetical protein
MSTQRRKTAQGLIQAGALPRVQGRSGFSTWRIANPCLREQKRQETVGVNP